MTEQNNKWTAVSNMYPCKQDKKLSVEIIRTRNKALSIIRSLEIPRYLQFHSSKESHTLESGHCNGRCNLEHLYLPLHTLPNICVGCQDETYEPYEDLKQYLILESL